MSQKIENGSRITKEIKFTIKLKKKYEYETFNIFDVKSKISAFDNKNNKE
jgi:hypothetical protein